MVENFSSLFQKKTLNDIAVMPSEAFSLTFRPQAYCLWERCAETFLFMRKKWIKTTTTKDLELSGRIFDHSSMNDKQQPESSATSNGINYLKKKEFWNYYSFSLQLIGNDFQKIWMNKI